MPGICWVLGDGHRVRFWQDKWLLNEPLATLSMMDIPDNIANGFVRDFWLPRRGWNLQQIAPFMSENNQLRLSSMVIDVVTGARDRNYWGESDNGAFSVGSAYLFLKRDITPHPNMDALYKRIWRSIVPERVRVFMWLVSHNAVMTNLERKRRHLTDNGICQLCKGREESIIHVLRDCTASAGIWQRIVPPNRRNQFFHQPLLEWIYENLAKDVTGQSDSSSTLFSVTIWWCWKWRCGYVFDDAGRCRDRVVFVKDKAKEVCEANAKMRVKGEVTERVEKLIQWNRPTQGCFKLNTDGASRGNTGLAAAGGAVRDTSGSWCHGFALNIGICSAPLAELWGVYYGLCIAWDRGIRRLELEVDSEMVVGFFRTGINESHPLLFLVRLCYGFLNRDWTVKISHVYREANCLADGLANLAFTLPLGLHLFDSIPDDVLSLWTNDVEGRAIARQIPL